MEPTIEAPPPLTRRELLEQRRALEEALEAEPRGRAADPGDPRGRWSSSAAARPPRPPAWPRARASWPWCGQRGPRGGASPRTSTAGRLAPPRRGRRWPRRPRRPVRRPRTRRRPGSTRSARWPRSGCEVDARAARRAACRLPVQAPPPAARLRRPGHELRLRQRADALGRAVLAELRAGAPPEGRCGGRPGQAEHRLPGAVRRQPVPDRLLPVPGLTGEPGRAQARAGRPAGTSEHGHGPGRRLLRRGPDLSLPALQLDARQRPDVRLGQPGLGHPAELARGAVALGVRRGGVPHEQRPSAASGGPDRRREGSRGVVRRPKSLCGKAIQRRAPRAGPPRRTSAGAGRATSPSATRSWRTTSSVPSPSGRRSISTRLAGASSSACQDTRSCSSG